MKQPLSIRSAIIVKDRQGQPLLKIVFRFNEDDLNKVRTLPGRAFDRDGKFWTAPLNAENIHKLHEWDYLVSPEIAEYEKEEATPAIPVKDLKIEGLRGELMPFQKEGVIFIDWKNGCALVGDEMGTGKTIQALAWLQLHPEYRPAIIVVPASLKLNWAREAQKWMSNPDIEILSGTSPYPTKGKIIIINYDILHDWLPTLQLRKPNVLIIDECFPAGANVSTPDGTTKIEDIKVGDIVLNATGQGIVQKIGKRETKELVRVHLSNNTYIDVTPNHLFFTTEGWSKAYGLRGKIILHHSDILNIFTHNINLNTHETNRKIMRMVSHTILNNSVEKTFLRNILLSEMEEYSSKNQNDKSFKRKSKENKQSSMQSPQTTARVGQRNFKTNDKKQPHIQSRNSEENKSCMEEVWPSSTTTTVKRGEWSTTTKSPTDSLGCIGIKLESRIINPHSKIKTIRIPHQLQSRHSFIKTQNMDRNRWLEPRVRFSQTKGQKERRTTSIIRVERVEILESGSGKQSPNYTVYNLQVSGHPSYYVEGYLVHNCHYIKNSAAQRTKATKTLAKGIPHRLGLTGTIILNRPVEGFNAFNIINPTIFPKFWHYAQRYCAPRNNGFGWDFTGASNTVELHEKLVNSFMIRRLKKDVLQDLPDKQYSFTPIEIDNEKEYENAERDFIAFVRATKGDKAATRASNAQALAEIEGLKQLAVSVSQTDRQKAIDDFQNVPSIRLFIGNIKAAGVGCTLTAASNVAFVELPWTPGDLSQAEDRCHRIGQKDSVNIHYLLSVGTIEEKIAHMLDTKRKVLASVHDGEEAVIESMLSELMNDYNN
jgi:hypothetical protein